MDTITKNTFCDSIMTINVTVTSMNTGVTRNGITLTATETSATYRWLDCGNSFAPINGEISQSFTPSVNGSYAVEITKNSCVDTSSCEQIASVGINESVSNNSLVLYPNPTSSILNIDTKGERIESVRIFNVSGQLMESELNNNNNSIDVSNYQSGLYIIQVETQNGTALSRFIKK